MSQRPRQLHHPDRGGRQETQARRRNDPAAYGPPDRRGDGHDNAADPDSDGEDRQHAAGNESGRQRRVVPYHRSGRDGTDARRPRDEAAVWPAPSHVRRARSQPTDDPRAAVATEDGAGRRLVLVAQHREERHSRRSGGAQVESDAADRGHAQRPQVVRHVDGLGRDDDGVGA